MLKGENQQMRKFHPSKLILALLLLVLSNWAQAEVSFSQVYVFGDSLSDTGNLGSIVGDLPPPFYMNRISNGPVAVETLAARLGLTAEASLHLLLPEVGSNYAVAGANAAGVEPIDLGTQILSFQANHIVAPADALYVILIGGNDVRDARDETNFWLARSKVKDAAAKVRKAVENLARIGAHSFLLVNSPNIGLIPETQLIATTTDDPDLITRTRALSKLYQRELRRAATHLRYTRYVHITEFDLFSFFNDLVENAADYGFNNTTDACFSSSNLTFHPDCDSGANFDQFIFFDEIHPTARVHALIGEALYESLDSPKEETWLEWYLSRFNISIYP
ncbi:MAG TPA: hypothetical protein ENK04_12110 [Gammaproteobacteria bacterium]|nr:hypothetical protein [Gammaproteobacteria bacterium]